MCVAIDETLALVTYPSRRESVLPSTALDGAAADVAGGRAYSDGPTSSDEGTGRLSPRTAMKDEPRHTGIVRVVCVRRIFVDSARGVHLAVVEVDASLCQRHG